MLSPGGNLSQQ